MSLTVLVIAAIPAVAVVFVAVRTESRFATALAAIAAGLLGVFTGNPHYALADIFAVALATWLAWPEAQAPMQVPSPVKNVRVEAIAPPEKPKTLPKTQPQAQNSHDKKALVNEQINQPERYCGYCRTLSTPKRTGVFNKPRCPNCGHTL